MRHFLSFTLILAACGASPDDGASASRTDDDVVDTATCAAEGEPCTTFGRCQSTCCDLMACVDDRCVAPVGP